MRLTPTGDRVVVLLDPLEETFGDSGLVRPDTCAEKPHWGEVIAVGPGRVTRKGVRVPPGVHRGDRVCVPWATGNDIYLNGRLAVNVREAEILAVEE